MPTRDYIDFQDRSAAKGYLITFRCYGTWLHGDERGSVDRRHFNRYGGAAIKPDPAAVARKARLLKQDRFYLGAAERKLVESAIAEVCEVRRYFMYAQSIRTEHVHVVVNNADIPERMMSSFKAYSTRAFRSSGLIGPETKVWSRHGSTRYLWTEEHIAMAVDYVVNGQGGEVPEFDRRSPNTNLSPY